MMLSRRHLDVNQGRIGSVPSMKTYSQWRHCQLGFGVHKGNKVRRWLLGLVCASYSLPSLCADVSDFWQSTYPHLREPTADSRPKVRTRADQKNFEALAAAGFGSAEIGIDFRGDPTLVRPALRALLETSRR